MLFVDNKGLRECMKFATACAYLCICSFGAMPSLPTIKEYNEKIKNRLD
jgi:sugar/nucleoside kinase (ribokinase family)